MIIDYMAKTKMEIQVRVTFSERMRQSTKHDHFRTTNFQIVDEMIRQESERPNLNKDKKAGTAFRKK